MAKDFLASQNCKSFKRPFVSPNDLNFHLSLLIIRCDKSNVSSFPHYDYLADIQDSLKQFNEENAIDILILLGEELAETSCQGIIERAFKSLGGNMKELISSLDGVYDVLKLQEEDLTDTSFVCAADDELIFTSDRICLAYLLLGILQKLSVKLFDEKCKIKMEMIDGSVQRFRYLFTMEEKKKVQEPSVSVRYVKNLKLKLFCKLS